MRYLFALFLLLPLFASAQIDTILTLNKGSQLYSAMTPAGLRRVSERNPPTSTDRDNFPAGLVLANSRATFYIWRNTCPTTAEDTNYMHIGPTGCWQRATNNYLAADWCLVRQGDTFRIDMQCLWDSLNVMYNVQGQLTDLYAKIKSDSIYAAQTYAPKGSIDTAFWNSAARQWNARKGSIVYTDSSYSNPSWLTSLDISKVPTAATQSFVNTGIQTLKTYTDNTFQPKGNYLTTPQTLTLSGTTLGITNGNTVTLPTSIGPQGPAGPTGPQGATGNTGAQGPKGDAGATGATGAQGVQGIQGVKGDKGDVGATGPAGTYTATSPIVITGSVISYSGLKPVSLPNVTVGETALVSLNAGVRNVVVTCSGVVAGDRILVTPTTAPAGYMIGAAVATAANQITVQVNAPLLAIGASYSIVCTVTAFR